MPRACEFSSFPSVHIYFACPCTLKLLTFRECLALVKHGVLIWVVLSQETQHVNDNSRKQQHHFVPLNFQCTCNILMWCLQGFMPPFLNICVRKGIPNCSHFWALGHWVSAEYSDDFCYWLGGWQGRNWIEEELGRSVPQSMKGNISEHFSESSICYWTSCLFTWVSCMAPHVIIGKTLIFLAFYHISKYTYLDHHLKYLEDWGGKYKILNFS